MKYFLLILLFVPMICFSNNFDKQKGDNEKLLANSKNVETILVYSTTASDTKMTYSYNSDNNFLEILNQIRQNDTWTNQNVQKMLYDNEGQSIGYVYQLWQNNEWVDASRQLKTINPDGYLLSLVNEIWQNDQWSNINRYTYTYDSKNNMLTRLYEKWEFNQTWQWVVYQNVIYNYDENGRQTGSVSEAKGSIGMTKSRVIYTYDENGNISTYLQQTFEDDKWVNYTNVKRTYNENGDILTDLFQQWDGEDWQNYSLKTITYHTNGNYNSWKEEYWKSDKWVISQKETLTYDDNGNRITYFYEYWENGELIFSERDYFTFDENNNEILWIYYELNVDEWEEKSRRISTYDSENRVLSKTYQKFIEGEWTISNAYSLTFFDYLNRSFSFRSCYKLEVSYQGGSSVETPFYIKDLSIDCFPNPSSDYINISYSMTTPGFAKLVITNSRGEEVGSIENNIENAFGDNNIRYDISHLSQGVYFLHIVTETSSKTKRFVVVR